MGLTICSVIATVKPRIKDAPKEDNLSTKDKRPVPSMSRFHCYYNNSIMDIIYLTSNWYAHIFKLYISTVWGFYYNTMVILRGVGSVKQHSLSNPTTCSPGGGPSLVLADNLVISITILGG